MLLNNNLYVGAKGDLTDGFVGCMRALVLNGVMVDLVGEAKKELYGIGLGCVGKCATNPCMNGGECKEQYSQFECDCRWTPFKVKKVFRGCLFSVFFKIVKAKCLQMYFSFI